jgi:hypothetical protein
LCLAHLFGFEVLLFSGESFMKCDFRRTGFLLATLAVVLLATILSSGQGITTGSISGTVEDPQGAVVKGAKVTATEMATGQVFNLETNNVGFFAFRGVPPGSYKVSIQSPNFRETVMSPVAVQVSRETSLGGITLELAKAGQVIEVNATAPVIETNTSQVTSTFTAKQAMDLPLSAGFDQLALFIPGVADTGSNNFSNTNGVGFSANGLRGRSNNFQIDGQSNNDNSVGGPSIFIGNQDIIGELSIITSDFDVEYGHSSGSVVNYVTKSGTNEFHGTAFEYNTNSFADSHTNEERSPLFGWCLAGQTPTTTNPCSPVQPPSQYNDNRYGGTIGGPIKHNKAWFFGSYMEENTRAAGSVQDSGANLTPTPNGLQQLASAFPGNPAVAALNAIGPYAVKAGNPRVVAGSATPLTVTDGVTSAPIEFGAVARNIPSIYNDYETVVKGDIQVTSKDRISVRYLFQQNTNQGQFGSEGLGFANGDWVDVPGRSQQIAGDWVRTSGASFVNQVRFSYSRAGFGFEAGSYAGCTRTNINNCPTEINLQGSNVAFGQANNLPQGRTIKNYQVQDNASMVRGRHTLKFGGEYYNQDSPNVFLPNTNGTYTFSGSGCAAGVTTTICSFNHLLQDTATLSLTQGTPTFDFKEQDFSAYFGDDFRVTPTLTVNLGLRWDFAGNAINLLHNITVQNQQGANPVWDPTLPQSVTTVPQIPNVYTYFGPSIGFAWSPGVLNGKTVLRGGYRITYDPEFYNMFLNVATAAPVVNAGSIAAANCVPCLPTSGFLGTDVRTLHLANIPTGGNPGARNNTRVSPNFRLTQTQGWQFGIQHELIKNVALEARYVGNHVTGNYQTINANPSLAGLVANGFSNFIPGGVAPCSTAGTPGFASGRANCSFTNFRQRANTGYSTYNGLQTQLRIASWHGLSSSVSYTWSKNIDNVSEIFSTFAGGNTVAGAQNPFDVSNAERGLSGLDFPQIASIQLIYDLPFYKKQTGVLGHALGGFQINTTWRYSSGQLWTPGVFAGDNSSCQTSFDIAYFGGASSCRPFYGNPNAPVYEAGLCTNPAASDCGLVNLYTGLPTTMNSVRWILNEDNAAAFFKTPYGNVPRNPNVRGDAVNTVNLSVFKDTKITERVSFRFEAQAVNVLNTMFRGVPDPFIEDGNFPDAHSSFANNLFNPSGGDYTNVVATGLSRRRFTFGGHIIF